MTGTDAPARVRQLSTPESAELAALASVFEDLQFVIGVAQAEDGRANGVAIVSSPLPLVTELEVRQTGRLALELSRRVDERMGEQQDPRRTGQRS